MRGIRRSLITAALVATLALTALAPGASTAPADGYKFPTSIKRAFVKSCAKGQATRKQCRCVIRKFERNYTYAQFKRLLRRVERTGKFPPKARRLIRSCA